MEKFELLYSVLKDLDAAGVLDKVILIGSWCQDFYKKELKKSEEIPAAMDVYLKSLKPLPSPGLVNGRLSGSARRGEKLFKDRKVGCASCHPLGLFTDLKTYDVGTRGRFDQPTDQFDTATLVEAWRTAPYLHDGSAASILEVLTTRNPRDEHGKTSHLTPQQLEDLAAYVLSL